MAGLWEDWLGPDGSQVETAVIITVDANADVAPIHERMPALLGRETWDAWLDPATPYAQAQAMLRPAPAGLLTARDTGNPLRKPPAQGSLF
jgi:putative SOS response-associated peptidase YedK